MTNIERKDHTAFILGIDDHPVVPDPEPEHPRERARQRLEEVSRIVSPLDLVQFSDHTLLDGAIETAQRLLGTRGELNAPVGHLFLLFSTSPQAPTALRRETAGPCPPAAASVNICRSMYSPFLPMLKDFTGRK